MPVGVAFINTSRLGLNLLSNESIRLIKVLSLYLYIDFILDFRAKY